MNLPRLFSALEISRSARRSLAAFGMLAILAPAASAQEYGSIKGRLVWGGAQVPKLAPLIKKGDNAAKDAAVCAKTDLADRSLVVDPSTKGVAYGFAYLNRPTAKNEAAVKELVAKAPKVLVDQKDCEFLPYALAIHKDQVVEIKSSDPVGHNVRYAGFANQPVNKTLAPNGSFEVKLQPERRPMQLKCDIHPWMSGWLFVFDHPFFAVTGEDGSFEIKGVPAGKHKLVVWQEKVGYVTTGASQGMDVTVEAGKATEVGDVKIDAAKVKGLTAK